MKTGAGEGGAAAALLAALEGRWRLVRAIEDRRGGPAGQFEGAAVFAPDGAGLAYRESGVLSLAGAAPMRAERRYLWRAEGARVAVRFADGRGFHAFEAGEDGPGAEHLCPPDLYRVRYDFAALPRPPAGAGRADGAAGAPAWRAVWEVQGPRKAYRMVARYDRP